MTSCRISQGFCETKLLYRLKGTRNILSVGTIGALHRYFNRAALCAFLAIPGGMAAAATLRITPHVDVSESYTDNVRGTSEGAEGDLITETTAGANFFADGNRLDLNLRADAIHEYYLDTDGLTSIRPQVLGTSKMELFEDHFFIDSSVSLSEQSTRRDGAISARPRSLPSNRSRILLYDVAPRLEYRFGRWLNSTLRYSHSESRVSKPSAGRRNPDTSDLFPPLFPGDTRLNQRGNQKSDDLSLLLQSGTRFTRISSSLLLLSEKSKSRNNNLKEKRADLRNEYRLNREIGLIGRIGYEEIEDFDDGLSSSGPTGAVGVHLTPGPRLDFTAEMGRKYDASNFFADLHYQISSFYVLSARYEQSVETQQTNLRNRLNRLRTLPDGTLLDPLTGGLRDPVDTGFSLNNSSFRQDQFELGFHGKRGRNTIGLSTSFSSRESGNATGRQEDILDAHLNLSRRLQPRLSGTVGLGYSDTVKASLGATGDTRYEADAGLDYALGPKLNSRLEYSHLNRDFDSGGGTSENVLTIGLNAEF